ncbi:hypothetical protein MFU01_76820 [Myxococcus fulvus]|uniref:Uncharacterized protein n=1 Tax=Myxococcus fulvus TaxID=33 RepID=A0A511TEP5_MYXFU|nr:hypothetical protein [Myxococcus fulvus]GEN12645.1 hypothetical protein MFU01_76820 [Myxococcus fulvus]
MPMKAPDSGRAIGAEFLGSGAVEESLYEADGPVLFTTISKAGQQLLAYVADESVDGTWLILSACTPRVVDELKRGQIAVRDALTSSWMWLAFKGVDGSLTRAWSILPDEVPDGHLPAPGTPLLPEHEPVITARAKGESIVAGATPASVVAFVADSTRKAIKILLEWVLERPNEGRPPDELRTLYDLPVQRFAFNSFEVAFGSPSGTFDSEELRRAANLLQKGLAWASDDNEHPLSAVSDDERSAILHAALQLTPPSSGPICEVEISGTWMSGGPELLTRVARRRIRSELRRLQSEHVVRLVGRIGEVDRDNFTFILRGTDEGTQYRGVFEEEMLDDVVDYFAEDRRVAVVGVHRAGRLYVAVISADAKAEGE